jgi:hypothetical protein
MSAQAKARPARSKGHWEEYRIELVGSRRDDGSMFVTSPSLTMFSAVLPDSKWEGITGFLKSFLELNFGRVKEMRLIRDASELMLDTESGDSLPRIPPAYVVAELNTNRVGAR